MPNTAIRWELTNDLFNTGHIHLNLASVKARKRNEQIKQVVSSLESHKNILQRNGINKEVWHHNLIDENDPGPYDDKQYRLTKSEFAHCLSKVPMDQKSRNLLYTKAKIVDHFARSARTNVFGRISRDSELKIIYRLKNLKNQVHRRCLEQEEQSAKSNQNNEDFAKLLGNTVVRKLTRHETLSASLDGGNCESSTSRYEVEDMLRRPRSRKHLSCYVDLEDAMSGVRNTEMKLSHENAANVKSLGSECGPVLLRSTPRKK